MRALDMDELLASLKSEIRDDREDRRSTPKDVLYITLQEIADRYAKGCQFKPGDLITPRSNYNKKGAGSPHIVLEVFDKPLRNFDPVEDQTDTGSPFFGGRMDVRVCCEMNGMIVSFVGESWQYETYSGPRAPPF